MDWFLYNNGLRHEGVKELKKRRKMPRKNESFKKLATILSKLLAEEGQK